MKKLQIIEVVMERLKVVSHPGDIEKIIDAAYSSVVNADAQGGMHRLNYYTFKKEGVAKLDLNNGRVVVEMGVTPMFIQNAGYGVTSVSLLGGRYVEAKPVYAAMEGMVKNLIAGGSADFVWYSVSRDDIRFYSQVKDGQKVEFNYIKRFEDIDMLEEVMVPAGFVDKLYEVSMSIAMNQIVRDTANDNVNE